VPTWDDLRSRFTALTEEIRGVEIHYQTGEERRYWLSGGTEQVRARFETVARDAGQKILELAPTAVHDLVRMRTNPVERWYEALRQHSDYFKPGADVAHQPRDGVRRPSKFGAIREPAFASIWVCRFFAGAPPKPARMPPQDEPSALEKFLRREKERRGATWALVGLFATALIGIGGVLVRCTPSSTPGGHAVAEPHK
jgi:hypothetical protein